MKQAAFDLGTSSAPEIDFDRSKLAPPEDLPAHFPEPVDDLQALAVVFCRVFGGCKSDEAIAKSRKHYTDALARFRQRGTPVLVAWQAFTDALIAQGGKPLFRGQAKEALGYLPSGRRPFTPKGKRVDSCGCPLPEGVFMPPQKAGETAHWDGEEFIFGNESDPR